MTTLFQMQNRQGSLVNINLNQENIEDRLFCWLEENHNHIFTDLEMWEGGSVRLDKWNDGTTTIVFSGDNGIFELEQVEIETI